LRKDLRHEANTSRAIGLFWNGENQRRKRET
jgi:hypothetical protein